MNGIPGERFIFSRVLGHFEMPRSHKWQESVNCWVCENHTYTIIIVSKSIAKTYFVKPKRKDREAFL